MINFKCNTIFFFIFYLCSIILIKFIIFCFCFQFDDCNAQQKSMFICFGLFSFFFNNTSYHEFQNELHNSLEIKCKEFIGGVNHAKWQWHWHFNESKMNLLFDGIAKSDMHCIPHSFSYFSCLKDIFQMVFFLISKHWCSYQI